MSEVVVITGATSGVGRATAIRFAQDGAKVALLGRSREALEGTVRDVEAAGGTALALPTDVAEFEQVEAAAAAAEEALGPIDVWVSNAMTTVFGFFADVDPDEYRRATEVTYLGAVWSAKAALQRMQPRDRGTIVLVGSALAKRGIPLQAPYCGAKHGIQGCFESLRCELRHAGSNVHVTSVHLPGLNTPQFDHCRSKVEGYPMPVPPIYQPEVAADAIHWAAHHRRRELYVGGSTCMTIWGSRLAPWFAEWYLARTGVSSQQTQPRIGGRDGNLFAALAEDPGAHGGYDAKAHPRSWELRVAKHRRLVAAGVGLAALALSAGRSRARSGAGAS
jgi:NAD(P)-dependent dehydrogenase (short-subunit alcohol dehydrogenase family)